MAYVSSFNKKVEVVLETGGGSRKDFRGSHVVKSMMAVEMAILELVMIGAVLEVVKATMIWTIAALFTFWTHERRKCCKQNL